MVQLYFDKNVIENAFYQYNPVPDFLHAVCAFLYDIADGASDPSLMLGSLYFLS